MPANAADPIAQPRRNARAPKPTAGGMVASVQLSRETTAAIDATARTRGVKRSEVLREAILSGLQSMGAASLGGAADLRAQETRRAAVAEVRREAFAVLSRAFASLK